MTVAEVMDVQEPGAAEILAYGTAVVLEDDENDD